MNQLEIMSEDTLPPAQDIFEDLHDEVGSGATCANGQPATRALVELHQLGAHPLQGIRGELEHLLLDHRLHGVAMFMRATLGTQSTRTHLYLMTCECLQ